MRGHLRPRPTTTTTTRRRTDKMPSATAEAAAASVGIRRSSRRNDFWNNFVCHEHLRCLPTDSHPPHSRIGPQLGPLIRVHCTSDMRRSRRRCRKRQKDERTSGRTDGRDGEERSKDSASQQKQEGSKDVNKLSRMSKGPKMN